MRSVSEPSLAGLTSACSASVVASTRPTAAIATVSSTKSDRSRWSTVSAYGPEVNARQRTRNVLWSMRCVTAPGSRFAVARCAGCGSRVDSRRGGGHLDGLSRTEARSVGVGGSGRAGRLRQIDRRNAQPLVRRASWVRRSRATAERFSHVGVGRSARQNRIARRSMAGVPAGSLTVRIRVVAAEVAGARVPHGMRYRRDRMRARHEKSTCLLQPDGALELASAAPRNLWKWRSRLGRFIPAIRASSSTGAWSAKFQTG